MASQQPAWNYETLKEVAAVLADTETGLTGKEIGDVLRRLKMKDPLPSSTKRDRLTEAFVERQNLDHNPRRIITFIVDVMQPVKYRDDPHLFSLRRDRLNERLTFVGLHVNEKGQIVVGALAQTLDEATRIATSVRDELVRRNTHTKVLRYCSLEVLKRDNFHACLEATKSIFDRLRAISGEQGDGAALVDSTLALGRSGYPKLAINSLTTQTERDEQSGFANLVKGLSGLYRNPTAHDPRLSRSISEAELLEALTLISMIHRRLDDAISTR